MPSISKFLDAYTKEASEATDAKRAKEVAANAKFAEGQMWRRCDTNVVGASGECLACDAEQGETCRAKRPAPETVE